MSNPAYTNPTYLGVPITGTQLKSLAPDAVRNLWKKGFDTFETTQDFFSEMEGKSAMSLIETVTDTSVGAGHSITFTVASGLYGEPHMGDETFDTGQHFEDIKIGTNKLVVDWFRHATRVNERAEEFMGMRGDIAALLQDLHDGTNKELGSWSGRLKSEALFMMYRERVTGENQITLSGGLTWDPIVENTQIMKRWGAPGAMVAKDPAGKPLRAYTIIACTDALTGLELDSTYRDILKTTKDEMGAKYIFSGGYTKVRGHVIKEYEAIDHDGYGAIGSPLNPMAKLGTAITLVTASNATPLRITGGGADYDASNILVKPMKYFPNYRYRFTPLEAVAGQDYVDVSSPTAFYVAIVNGPSAVTDANKYGLYKCLGNDGLGLTVTDALVDGSTVSAGAGSGGGPTLATTIGNVAWSASAHSYTHVVGAMVVKVTADAKAEFKTLILGAQSARRGYGKYRGQRGYDEKEDGFIKEVYFKSVFGQAPRTNRLGRAPGVIVLTHTGKYAGMPLPA